LAGEIVIEILMGLARCFWVSDQGGYGSGTLSRKQSIRGLWAITMAFFN
jgi:hypothetical protein